MRPQRGSPGHPTPGRGPGSTERAGHWTALEVPYSTARHACIRAELVASGSHQDWPAAGNTQSRLVHPARPVSPPACSALPCPSPTVDGRKERESERRERESREPQALVPFPPPLPPLLPSPPTQSVPLIPRPPTPSIPTHPRSPSSTSRPRGLAVAPRCLPRPTHSILSAPLQLAPFHKGAAAAVRSPSRSLLSSSSPSSRSLPVAFPLPPTTRVSPAFSQRCPIVGDETRRSRPQPPPDHSPPTPTSPPLLQARLIQLSRYVSPATSSCPTFPTSLPNLHRPLSTRNTRARLPSLDPALFTPFVFRSPAAAASQPENPPASTVRAVVCMPHSGARVS